MISEETRHWSRHGSRCAWIVRSTMGSLAGMIVSAALVLGSASAQQAPQGQQPRALKDMSLKEACPEVRQDAGASGTAMEPAQRAVTQMQTCIDRLKLALGEKPDKEAFDNDLKIVIEAAQASVNLLKGQGGLTETATIYLNRLRTQLDDIPRRVTKDKQEAHRQELNGLIKQASEALTKLETAAKELNETVIYLNSQRPEIAYDLSVADVRDKVGALNRAVDIINNASSMLNNIGRTLGASKPGM